MATTLLSLSDDDLIAVLLLADTRTLGRLMCTCHHLDEALRSPLLLRMLALSRGFKEEGPQDDDNQGTQYTLLVRHVDSIEALAVLEAMRRLESNHILFRLGSLVMTPSSVNRLCGYAELLHRHSRLLLRIDSHTGVGAPPMIHRSHSVRRASIVADYLDDKGIGSDRVSANAWGYRVGMKNHWPARPEFARVELSVAFAPASPGNASSSGDSSASASASASGDDSPPPCAPSATTAFDRSACLPSWPSYYEEVKPVRSNITFDHADKDFDFDAIDDEAGDNDGDDDHVHNGVPIALLPLLQQLQGLQGLGPGDTVTLSNGQVVDGVALLQLLQQLNGGQDSDEELDDGNDDDDDEEEEEDSSDENEG